MRVTADWQDLYRQLVGAGFDPDDAQDIMSIVALWGGVGESHGELAEAEAVEVRLLADLRAKVEWMRNEALEGFRSQPDRSYLGTMASTLGRVLNLIEEAQHD